MQGFYDIRGRETDYDPSGADTDERRHDERRGHLPDRRKKERRKKEKSRKSTDGLLQPILTQAEIAALLRGAR